MLEKQQKPPAPPPRLLRIPTSGPGKKQSNQSDSEMQKEHHQYYCYQTNADLEFEEIPDGENEKEIYVMANELHKILTSSDDNGK